MGVACEMTARSAIGPASVAPARLRCTVASPVAGAASSVARFPRTWEGIMAADEPLATPGPRERLSAGPSAPSRLSDMGEEPVPAFPATVAGLVRIAEGTGLIAAPATGLGLLLRISLSRSL